MIFDIQDVTDRAQAALVKNQSNPEGISSLDSQLSLGLVSASGLGGGLLIISCIFNKNELSSCRVGHFQRWARFAPNHR